MAQPRHFTCSWTRLSSHKATSAYLTSPRFTFLAVLILLLIVSVAVIVRSLILRQRFRRSIEEALAAGIIFDYPPGHRPGRFKKDLGTKPVLTDAWIESGIGSSWNDMQVGNPYRWYSSMFDADNGQISPPFNGNSLFQSNFKRKVAQLSL